MPRPRHDDESPLHRHVCQQDRQACCGPEATQPGQRVGSPPQQQADRRAGCGPGEGHPGPGMSAAAATAWPASFLKGSGREQGMD